MELLQGRNPLGILYWFLSDTFLNISHHDLRIAIHHLPVQGSKRQGLLLEKDPMCKDSQLPGWTMGFSLSQWQKIFCPPADLHNKKSSIALLKVKQSSILCSTLASVLLKARAEQIQHVRICKAYTPLEQGRWSLPRQCLGWEKLGVSSTLNAFGGANLATCVNSCAPGWQDKFHPGNSTGGNDGLYLQWQKSKWAKEIVGLRLQGLSWLSVANVKVWGVWGHFRHLTKHSSVNNLVKPV